jgi:hypothetical protein
MRLPPLALRVQICQAGCARDENPLQGTMPIGCESDRRTANLRLAKLKSDELWVLRAIKKNERSKARASV